ncbi:MAG: single-stranded DNA-binding protein [Bacteroidetes bacterium]|nr:single-stranded DNA-binding protein [Bacteroidota bacterium]
MSGINKVILIGNLGKDPEIKYLEGNIARASFSLATSDYYRDKSGNKIEQTEWHNIVLWRAMAENAEKILKKGMQVYIEGKIQTRQWIDKDGNKKNITEIAGETFTVLQRRDSNTSNSSGNSFDIPSDKTGNDELPY